MEIRKAEISDINRINELFWELDTQSVLEQPKHFQRGERSFEYLCSLIYNENSDFLLAIADHMVIGFSLLLLKEVKGLSLLVPCTYTYIQDFIISKEYRNKGYGSLLLSESKKWALEHKSNYLRLSVIPKNEAGITFYRKNGLIEQMITMECSIPSKT